MHALGPDWMDPQYLFDTYGSAFFWLSLAIVFVECGLFFPILPGDSLLFAIGIFVAGGQLHVNIVLAMAALFVAAFAGNVVGYEIGRAVGAPLRERDGKVIRREYFEKTTEFFDRYGARALVIGRFVPIVRTYITVVAGIGRMQRRHFFTWSAVGAALWVLVVTLAGYFLGGVPLVRDNLEAAILLIVALSVLPMVIEYLRHRRSARVAAAQVAPQASEAVEDVEPR
ncbi:VTT domain-containing protein [Phycicoccus endophyticus]|uniref:VTT domain-containing protein n=1 Tax=Phycicoccus endophyticus TaxID=1690220 RepID=A0A7G9R634_9MICO|nr:VTT domain-containing protein [Phycicoccus endophyticus]NHI20198.1 DedA family protein [Phycicoccus endophyticus]QNN51059.1 VTT domain-containing protein [Phycicoccus endophyticus]GGL44512.1 cytochrome o ubiquinol oxidase [Phycicoccus endophyticus]